MVPAKYNDYSIELLSRSSSPLRFVQSVGYKEIFMRRYVDGDFEESTMQKLNEWYLNFICYKYNTEYGSNTRNLNQAASYLCCFIYETTCSKYAFKVYRE